MSDFLEFKECQGCGELFPIRSIHARNAKWCSNRCRKAQRGDPCVDCGARTCYGAEQARVAEPHCDPCRLSRLRARRLALCNAILDLRVEGLLNHEIAARLGVVPHTVAQYCSEMRAAGIDVPASAYVPVPPRRVAA